MSNCPRCGLLIGHGTMGTVLPLCQCGWQRPMLPAGLPPVPKLTDYLQEDLSASQARETELQEKLELMTADRDSESRWASEYKQRAETAEARIKELECQLTK